LSKVISIAGINSDRGLTLAGTAQSLAKFEMRLTKERVGFKRLALDYAFHSPEMDSIQTAIEEALSHLTPKTGDIAFYSSVTGGLLDGTALTAEYWWKNIRQPVLFESATNQLLSQAQLQTCLRQPVAATKSAGYRNQVHRHHRQSQHRHYLKEYQSRFAFV
jgi:acyl transferase domain-containing protein